MAAEESIVAGKSNRVTRIETQVVKDFAQP